MTAPAVERTAVQDHAFSEALGLALLWLIPVIGFLLAFLSIA